VLQLVAAFFHERRLDRVNTSVDMIDLSRSLCCSQSVLCNRIDESKDEAEYQV
jgi:hypothetical protein